MTDEEIQALRDELKAAREELDSLKTEKGTLTSELETRNNRITELETTVAGKDGEVQTLKESVETAATELAAVTEVKDQAVSKYIAMAKALYPQIPEGLISGGTIAEIDASIEKGKGIVETVKKAMEAEAAAGKVPAGAPPRTPLDLSALSPREKIQYAIGGKK